MCPVKLRQSIGASTLLRASAPPDSKLKRSHPPWALLGAHTAHRRSLSHLCADLNPSLEARTECEQASYGLQSGHLPRFGLFGTPRSDPADQSTALTAFEGIGQSALPPISRIEWGGAPTAASCRQGLSLRHASPNRYAREMCASESKVVRPGPLRPRGDGTRLERNVSAPDHPLPKVAPCTCQRRGRARPISPSLALL